MSDLLTNKNQLLSQGYCVIRNLFNDKEVDEYKSIIRNVHGKINDIGGLHNYREYWDLIVNERLLKIIRYLLGPDIYYLYNSNSSIDNKNEMEDDAWHRDNACRIFGTGPDWDPNEPYKVLRAGIYLSSFNDTGSGLNVIPRSHKKKYTLSGILRLLYYKTKYFPLLKSFRKKISKFIGVNIQTDAGDCIIFLANLFHTGIPTRGLREAIYLSYGINDKHSKNYVNYYMEHRKGFKMENKEMREDFIILLKSKNIYFPLPEKKQEIKGASIPLSDK